MAILSTPYYSVETQDISHTYYKCDKCHSIGDPDIECCALSVGDIYSDESTLAWFERHQSCH